MDSVLFEVCEHRFEHLDHGPFAVGLADRLPGVSGVEPREQSGHSGGDDRRQGGDDGDLNVWVDRSGEADHDRGLRRVSTQTIPTERRFGVLGSLTDLLKERTPTTS